MTDALALALRDIHRSFGAVAALRGASCEIRRGTVHALLGENGAGKTTLMRIAFGLESPDSGVLEFDGRAVRWRGTAEAIRAGIGMVHQHFMLVPALTVAENVALGDPRFPTHTSAARTRALSASTGLDVDPDAVVGELSVSAQQRAEILRALAHDASVLILDEPTAVLAPADAEELYRWVRRFAAGGGTVVLITHRLADALAVADDITVLRGGATVLAAPRASLDEAALIAAVVGTLDERPSVAPVRNPTGARCFALHEAAFDDPRGVRRLHPVTLEVREGEILGVLGVEHSGHQELLRMLAGRLRPTEGRVEHPVAVGFVPEDRHRDAVIPAFSLAENVALAGAGARRGRLSWDSFHQRARQIVRDFAVHTTGVSAPVSALSGGNQQRFVVGRESALAPRALVAENPTRGLDVRSARQVWSAITAVADVAGGAAVVYSTDLDEILAITRRVVVCSSGRVIEVAPPDDPADVSPYARALTGLSA
jgi:simple sugar transport system ATP-binding protein